MKEHVKKEFTPQQYKKFNGQSLMSALKSMGGAATAEALCEVISGSIQKPEHVIKPEVMQVLRRGISNGFLERRGKSYLLYAHDTQMDHAAKKKSMIRKIAKKTAEKGSKNANNRKAESIIEAILKASRETQEAAMMATDAARQASKTAEEIIRMSKQTTKNKAPTANVL